MKILLENPDMGKSYVTGKLVLSEDSGKVLEVLASITKAKVININESTYGLR